MASGVHSLPQVGDVPQQQAPPAQLTASIHGDASKPNVYHRPLLAILGWSASLNGLAMRMQCTAHHWPMMSWQLAVCAPVS